jgi:hypothetical protein
LDLIEGLKYMNERINQILTAREAKENSTQNQISARALAVIAGDEGACPR